MFELIFHPDAEQEIIELEYTLQGQVHIALTKLEAKGNKLRYPDTDIIQQGLFELRAGYRNITRTLFAYAKGRRIYILRTFIKKTNKTLKIEITLALKRLEEVIDES